MASRTTTSYSNPVTRGLEKVETLTAAKTLTPGDSGKTFYLVGASTVGYNITLPAVTNSGCEYTFVLKKLTATTAWTITAATAVIQGIINVNYASVVATNESLITFAHTADTLGDTIHLISDGTSWHVDGFANQTVGITVTAP